jgi:hypothetical protein
VAAAFSILIFIHSDSRTDYTSCRWWNGVSSSIVWSDLCEPLYSCWSRRYNFFLERP